VEDPSNPKYKDIDWAVQELIASIIQDLEEMSKINDSNSNMHFYIGLFKVLSGHPNEAVQSIMAAIEKSDDNYFNHYFWKGIAMAVGGCYDLALTELETARNIDKSNLRASVYIGTCHLILGDLDSAYEAFKNVIGDMKLEMEVNFCIGKFFMMRGFMGHAIQSFQFALKNFSLERVYQELAKCYIGERNLVAALDVYQKLEVMSAKNRKLYSYDISILEGLKKCCEDSLDLAIANLSILDLPKKEGFIFQRFDLMLYIGVAHFLKGDYPKALKCFTLMEMEFYSKDEDRNLPPSFESDAFNAMFIPQAEREGQMFVSTKSVTRPELIYNMAVCQLMLNQFDRAYMKLSVLLFVPQIRPKVRRLMDALKNYVSQEVQDKAIQATEKRLAECSLPPLSQRSKGRDRLKSLDIDFTDENFLPESQRDEGGLQDLNPFPVENRLCSIFGYVPVPRVLATTDSSTVKHPQLNLLVTLSFCLPSIKISDIKIVPTYSELQTLNLRSVEFKPEAPWVKKIQENIVFTSHLVEQDAVECSGVLEVMAQVKSQQNNAINSLVRVNIVNACNDNLRALESQRARQLQQQKLGPTDERSIETSNNEHDSPDGNTNPRCESERAVSDAENSNEKPNIEELKKKWVFDDKTTQLLNKVAKPSKL
jgi:tetratricopeptide (TPR) repeat protein